MTAQPIHPAEVPPSESAAAQLRDRIAHHRYADRWLPAYEAAWAHALDDARRTYSLAPLHQVVREWSGRLATEPAVTAWRAAGGREDDDGGVLLEDVLGPRL